MDIENNLAKAVEHLLAATVQLSADNEHDTSDTNRQLVRLGLLLGEALRVTDILTVPEAVDYTRIGKNRLYQLLKDGVIPHKTKKGSKQILVLRSDLEDYMEFQTELAMQEA